LFVLIKKSEIFSLQTNEVMALILVYSIPSALFKIFDRHFWKIWVYKEKKIVKYIRYTQKRFIKYFFKDMTNKFKSRNGTVLKGINMWSRNLHDIYIFFTHKKIKSSSIFQRFNPSLGICFDNCFEMRLGIKALFRFLECCDCLFWHLI